MRTPDEYRAILTQWETVTQNNGRAKCDRDALSVWDGLAVNINHMPNSNVFG